MTPEAAAITGLAYWCVGILAAIGLLVVIASLWDAFFEREEVSARLAREVAREIAADDDRKLRSHIGADEHGITTAAVPGD